MKKRTMILSIIAIVFLAGCAVSADTETIASPPGIRIVEMDTAIGGVEGSPDEQSFSYNLTLLNTEPFDIVVHWIEPVLGEAVSSRTLTPDRRVIVEKTLPPNTYLEVSGGFTFDSQGATKTQILSWEPFITGISVSTEMILSIPDQAEK